jgi:hypothetical protein
MGLKELILIVSIIITLAIAIPIIIDNHRTIKEIEKHYEQIKGCKRK